MWEEFRISPTCFDACVARGPIRTEENAGWEDGNQRSGIKVQLQHRETAIEAGSGLTLMEMLFPLVWSDQTTPVLHQLLCSTVFTVSLDQVQSWLPQACCLHHPSFWLVHLSSYGNQYQRSIQRDIWVGFTERNSFFFFTFFLCLRYLQLC